VPLAALEERFDLVHELGNPPTQLGVLGFQFNNPFVAGIFHDPRITVDPIV
jgi:hypothetical protein